jgi:hypothetical protein
VNPTAISAANYTVLPSEPRFAEGGDGGLAAAPGTDGSEGHGRHDPFAVRIGTRPVQADDDQVVEARRDLVIHILARPTAQGRTFAEKPFESFRIIVTAAEDAKDIHDDILESRLGQTFRDLRVASDGSMWGDVQDVHGAAAQLAADGWDAKVGTDV